jgi:integrase
MAVRQRGEGWQADVCRKGKRIREQFATEDEARIWEREAAEALKRGKPIPAARSVSQAQGYATLGGLVGIVTSTRWNKPGAHQMVSCAKRFVAFTGANVTPAEAFTQTNVDAFLAHIAANPYRGEQVSDATMNKHRSALSVLMKRAMSAGTLTRKPDLEWSKEGEARIRYYTDDEEALIIQMLTQLKGTLVADFFIFLVCTGARTWREGASLAWKDVNDKERAVTFWDSKGGAQRWRSVPCVTRAWDAIQRQRGNGLGGPFMALNKDDLRSTYDLIRAKVPELADTVWYTARHTFASRLVQRGVDLYTVQKLMGHTDPKMTQRYAKLAPANLRSAVGVLEDITPQPTLVVNNG